MLEYGAALCAGIGAYLLAMPPHFQRWRGYSVLSDLWGKKARSFADFAAVAGTRISLGGFLGLSAALGLSVGLVSGGMTGLGTVGILAGCFAVGVPYLTLQARRAKTRLRRGKAWPNLVDNLVSGVRAGLSLGDTLLEMTANPPKTMQVPFAHFAAHYRAGGNLDVSLKALKAELADPIGDRIVEALLLASQVGGNNLVALLEDLGTMLRAEERTRAEVLARQSWTITGARLAAAAPWVVLALLLTRGQTLEVYSTPTGSVILLMGASVSVVAYLTMLRLGRLEVSPRTMRDEASA